MTSFPNQRIADSKIGVEDGEGEKTSMVCEVENDLQYYPRA